MIITIIPIALLIGSIIAHKIISIYSDYDMPIFIIIILSAAFTIGVALALPLCRLESKKFSLQFIEVQKTITDQRGSAQTEYERATLTKTIVDLNKELIEQQFYADNIWTNWFYDKSVLTLKSIK